MINHFTFNGTSTAQLGLIVSGVSIFGAGSRKVEKAGIPGRNGDLQIELGGFNNYTVRYTVSITNDFSTTAQQIREWLLESKGYCELTDTYHPDEIRKACFNSDIEFTTTMLYKYGQASIQFDCLPQRYIIRNTPITTTATEDTTTDTTMSLNTVPTPIKITLNGNTTQEGTPTPGAPQSIHNVTGYNEIKIVRKNLCGEFEYYNSSNYAKIMYLPTGDYTLSFQGGETPSALYIRQGSAITSTAIKTVYDKKVTSFTVSTAGTYFLQWYKANSTSPPTFAQLEYGSTATTYEPYTEQLYPLNLGSIELNKIGSYQDYIYKNGEKWYVHKETRTLNLAVANMNNAENFPGWRNITETQLMKTDYPNQNTGLVAMTDYFTNVNTENTGVSINTQSSNSVIYLAGSGYTQTQWITNFSSLTIKLIYGLQSAENAEITGATLINQLNNIEKAYSYNGTTNILQESNDNGFMLGVVSLHGSTFASSYKGEPIITVNSTGLIYLNGEVMEVLSAPVTINCQTMQCYNGVVNMNNEVRVNDFPEIKIGTNEVGSSMALTITPNNWRH